MTVKELKQALEGVDDSRIVIMSKDEEGNGFSPLAEASTENDVYMADSTWSGEIALKELTPELKEQGYTEEDLGDGEDCIVLWPTN